MTRSDVCKSPAAAHHPQISPRQSLKLGDSRFQLTPSRDLGLLHRQHKKHDVSQLAQQLWVCSHRDNLLRWSPCLATGTFPPMPRELNRTAHQGFKLTTPSDFKLQPCRVMRTCKAALQRPNVDALENIKFVSGYKCPNEKDVPHTIPDAEAIDTQHVGTFWTIRD